MNLDLIDQKTFKQFNDWVMVENQNRIETCQNWNQQHSNKTLWCMSPELLSLNGYSYRLWCNSLTNQITQHFKIN